MIYCQQKLRGHRGMHMRAISHVPYSRRGLKWFCACLLATSPLLWNCGRDAEIPVVDFARTISVEGSSQKGTEELPALRVAVGAMISPKETFVHYRALLTYVGKKTARAPEFIQRKTYGEINELLGGGLIDIAFICTGPYATGAKTYGFEPIAVPLTGGRHFYRSYLIVKAEAFNSLADLEGRTFAFTDPESNTGRLVPTFWLRRMGQSPESYFGKIIYTYSHDNSILAVSRGLVDGAAVDSLIWEYYESTNPALTASARVVKRSEPYPIPPIVASRYFPEHEREQVGLALFNMHHDPEGRQILVGLKIDRFIPPPREWFEKLERVEEMLAFSQGKVYEHEKP
jgi:phosphonate transport system substrate-binding protein